MASITGRAPPMAVSGAAAATTMNTIPQTPMEPRSFDGASTVLVLMVCSDMAASCACCHAGGVGGGARRYVEGGVAVEEPDRLEREARGVDRHDRPVLRTRCVGQAEGVPDDDVLPVEVSVGGGVRGQPRSAGMLVDEVARRV